MFLAGQAVAADRTVSNSVTTPVTTSDPDGDGTASPGNILIDANGKVTITSAGAAVTINSDNTVTNNGTISNTANTGAVGIHILGGFTGNLQDTNHRPIGLTGTGSISATPSDTDTTHWGAGNIGVLIDGAGNFTGDIDLHAMTVNAKGPGAIGVAVNTGLVGNVLMGSTSAVGTDASALRTTASIDGFVSFTGSVVSSGVSTLSTTDIDALNKATVAIGSDVTHGILNTGAINDDDKDHPTTSILSAGAPAVEISPTIAGAGSASLTIGVLTDTDNPGFSFVNRGALSSSGNDPGINVTTLLIGREDGDADSHTATLTGGIFNRGSIQAAATSSNSGATDHDPANADATAVRISAGGSVPTLVNDTPGNIAAATGNGPKGGTATAILIDVGGTLTSLTNRGNIGASAGTTAAATDHITDLSAIAIWDKSGTLTSIDNSGKIVAITFLTNDGTTVDHRTVLLGDFSANTTTLTFNNSGTLNGDIVFGAGTNQFTINGDDAVANGSYHAATGGALDVTVTNGSFTTNDTSARNLNVGDKGVVNLSTEGTGSTTPQITLTGDSNFVAGSKLAVAYSELVGDHASFELLHADGALSFDNLAASTAGTTPFLYNTTFANDGHDLTLDMTRKTSAQLGFEGDVADLYEPAIAAVVANDDTKLGQALMGLHDEQSTIVAFQSMAPIVNGAQRNYAISLTDQSFGPVGARQRALISTPNQGHNLAFWGQEFYLANRNDGSSGVPGYSDSGFGVAAGADYGSLASGRYGVAFEHFNGDSVEGEPRVNKTVNNWTVFSLYADWADADTGLFFGTQGSFGFGSFDSKRRLLIGDYTPTAKGHWTGWLTAGGASVGDVIGDDTFAIIPQADIDALYMSESDYREGGDVGAARLAVGGRTSTSIRGFVGLVGRAQFEFAGGYVRPELHIGWTHEFAGHPSDANVYFISAQNMHFRISGPAEPVSRFVGGGSLSFVYNNWSVGGDYDTTVGSNTKSDAGSLTVTGHF